MSTQCSQHTNKDREHTCSPDSVLSSHSGVNSAVLPLQQVLVCSVCFHSWEARRALCSTMPTHLGLFRNWPNFYSTLVWDCKQGKTIWILHGKMLMKYHNLQESLLDITQSRKQEPACTQQLTFFLRGYDISHDVSLTSRTQTPLLPSLLLSLAGRQPQRSSSPSLYRCHKGALL